MKNFIVITTILGLLPFYLEHFSLIFNISFLENEKIQITYGAIIISYLSGMQMQRYISENEISKTKLALPLLNSLWGWSFIFNELISPSWVISLGLIYSLLIDLLLQRNLLKEWFIKLRVYVTFLAILSYVI
ncbi:DUF3429 domain-containing protein [Rickettsiales bacterium]|nr:DUF3429 domain-containing protein [Rickettsiales bacterium]